MRLVSGFVLLAAALADECGRICERIPAACSAKGSYCKNAYACMDLFWATDGSFCNLAQSGCSDARPVKCSEARDLGSSSASVSSSATTTRAPAAPVTISTRPASLSVAVAEAAVTSRPAPVGPVSGIRGITNLGATCYLASVLQILFHARSVRALADAPPRGPVMTHFQELLRGMWAAGDEPLSPVALLDALRTANGGAGFVYNEADDASMSAHILMNHLAAASSAFENVFTMRLNVERTCLGCGVGGQRVEIRRSQIVSIPDPSRPAALLDMLRVHFAGGVMAGFRCDICASADDMLLMPEVDRAPAVLVLTINRYSASAEKLTTSVEFPFEFNLADVARTARATVNYRLIGIVRHNNGHYTSDYLHPDSSNWIHTDDRHVHPIVGRPRNSGPEPYVVIYEAI